MLDSWSRRVRVWSLLAGLVTATWFVSGVSHAGVLYSAEHTSQQYSYKMCIHYWFGGYPPPTADMCLGDRIQLTGGPARLSEGRITFMDQTTRDDEIRLLLYSVEGDEAGSLLWESDPRWVHLPGAPTYFLDVVFDIPDVLVPQELLWLVEFLDQPANTYSPGILMADEVTMGQQLGSCSGRDRDITITPKSQPDTDPLCVQFIGAVVPEPTALMLLFTLAASGLFCLLARAKRNRSRRGG